MLLYCMSDYSSPTRTPSAIEGFPGPPGWAIPARADMVDSNQLEIKSRPFTSNEQGDLPAMPHARPPAMSLLFPIPKGPDMAASPTSQ